MTIRAIVFDIGGVLEITPRIGVTEKWEAIFHLQAGELDKRLYEVWKGGSIGTITEADVHQQIGDILSIKAAQVNAFMDDTWKEYLGTLDVELANYFTKLHQTYITAIISNSFVGAREKEIATYHFDKMTELIIYSHEVGIQKPDPRIFELACERLEIKPEEMIFVDDVEENIAAAQQLGIHGILHQNTAQTIAEIEAAIGDKISTC
ncbi:MAG: HAD family phosphatase [Anaerolineae bacterium]|nr:HAD family phosphatase [Anaerolineae bacterium]